MRPWRTRLACLGLAWACMVWVGCGKSDVPDPSSDPNAATDAAPEEGSAAPAAAQNAPGKEAEVEEKEEPAVAEASSKEEPAPKTEAAAPADSKSSSATAEMLAMANSAPGASEEGQEASGAASPGAPGAPGGQGGMQPPGMGMPSGYPAGGANQQGMMANQMAQQQAMMAQQQKGMASMMPGAGAGGAGGAGSAPSDEPADFSTQVGAVNAFLNALKAKDPIRLKEATALRAEESNRGKRNEKLFKSILDESISQDEVEDLAKRFDGFQVVGQNIPKTTATLGIILQKQDRGRDILQRTITVRREKAGWKVAEIGPERLVPGSFGTTTRRRGR